MENPIISPWIVYAFVVYPKIMTTMGILTFLLGIFVFVWIIVKCVRHFVDESEFMSDETPAKIDAFLKAGRKAIYFFILFCTLLMVTPTRNELIVVYSMHYLTFNRVNTGMNELNNLKEVMKRDLIEIIEAVKKGTSDEKKEGK